MWVALNPFATTAPRSQLQFSAISEYDTASFGRQQSSQQHIESPLTSAPLGKLK